MLFFSTGISAQENYYEVICTSSTYFDDEKNEHVKDDFGSDDKIVLSDEYMLYFRNPTYEDGPFRFSHLEVFERATGRAFKLRSSYRNPLFQRVSLPNLDLFGEMKPTGVTKIINTHQCDEYLHKHGDKKLYTYVAKQLPFVNIFGTKNNVPGFISSFQMILSMNGKEYIKTAEFDIKEITYDSTFFKYIPELKKQHPSNQILNNPDIINNIDLPTFAIKFINNVFHPAVPHPYKIKNEDDFKCDNLKSIFRVKDDIPISKSYYNANGELIQKLVYKGNELKLESDNSISDCYNFQSYNEKRYAKTDTIYDLKYPNNYSIVDDQQNTINKYYSWGSKVLYKYSENDMLVAEISVKEEKSNTDTTLFSFNKDGLLENSRKVIYRDSELIRHHVKDYTYYDNGLLSTISRDEEKESFIYTYRPSEKIDTVYVIKRMDDDRKVYMYCFDSQENLIFQFTENKREHTSKQNIIEYYPSKDQTISDSSELDLTMVFETEYLKLVNKMNNISFSIKESENKHDRKVSKICKSNFLVKRILRQNHSKSDFYWLKYFPEVQFLDYELLSEDDKSVYYKVFYKETIVGFVDRIKGHFSMVVSNLESKFGKKIIKGNSVNWTVELERDSRYAIIKYDKSKKEWAIN